MKPEEQRIAIAEACGWTRIEGRKGLPPGKTSHAPSLALSDSDDGWLFIPDYLNDLNAMHEAEKVLTPKQRDSYFWELLEATSYCGLAIDGLDGNNGGFEFISMSATQRAEAFLRTLNLYTP